MKHNMVLLTIDAWRADFVDTYAGVRLCPALDALPRSVRFDRLYANAPWTTPALVSMFTGQRVHEHGVHYAWSTPKGPGLVSHLKATGYNAPNLCYLNRVPNYANLGYALDGPEAPTGPTDETLLRAIAETPEPYFLWFHYKYVHLPYWPAERYRRMFGVETVSPRIAESVAQGFVVPRWQYPLHDLSADEIECTRRLYAACVRQMSDQLQRVIDALDLDRTCFVLTADHGDELFEHDHVGHASTAHHGRLTEELLRIPLVIADPRAQPGRVDLRMEGRDLYPTLLSLAGVEASSEAVDFSCAVLEGRLPNCDPSRPFHFASARRGYLTPREEEGQMVRAVSDGRFKLVEERYEELRRGFYDLEADPGEAAPIEPPDRHGLQLPPD